ncbi:hypothetical protein LDENG_00157750 [Lucifuga dentata]|nr:hypothetical protein LDENG_00157750 [Lucifuga dentata]
MPSIESLTVTYDALNEDATFSEGDRLTGKVTLVLSKETEVEEFFVKAKGDARVHWTERRNERTHSYSAHRRFFKLKHFFVPENKKGTVLPAGIHIHNFSFNIPSVGMPSSFKGIHGKIVYMLEAKVSRSWRMDSTAERELKFVSKCFPNIQHLMLQQVGSTDKEMGFFSKGHVHMDATVDRKAYAPGEVVCIVAKVNNSSSKDMTPKFSLKQNVLYHAQGHKKYKEKSVSRAVGEVIRANQEKTVHCALKIPADEILTIQNCDIISVEYHLKVSLDISFSFDPEVSFPIVLLSKTCLPGGAMGPNPAGAVGGPRKSDFPPPTMSTGPSYPVSPGRDEAPPAYMSLFPPNSTEQSTTGSDAK